MKKSNFNSYVVYMIVAILILMVIFANNNNDLFNPNKLEYSYSHLITQLEDSSLVNQIKLIEIRIDADILDTGEAIVHFNTDAKKQKIEIVSMSNFMPIVDNAIKENNLAVKILQPSKVNFFMKLIVPFLIVGAVCFIFMMFMQQVQGGGGSKAMNFGKSRAKLVNNDKNKITYNDVAGLQEEKEDMVELVDFLKHPKKFIDIGARVPKGVLLVGPPGTGKTLLAKAVAGEAGVPFFSISGSDFVEMFVGVGASRVRDLFEQAKKNIPCVIFIDEIDAVGRRRGAGLGGGHDEREQTLNQLLVEMDGFSDNEGVIIIAATNRVDILDPALLRPGRFDRQISVNPPDVKGREDILKVHAKGKKISSDVDLSIIAKTTPGFTGADLENLLNEAALLAAREDKKELDSDHLRRSFVKVGIGMEKKSRIISESDKKITAYHEAGHAIIFEFLPEADPVHIVSIIPTGSTAAGYTMPLPRDKGHITKSFLLQRIISLFGGRAAEELVLGDITTGASNDIERATAIARDMVKSFGMSDTLGPIQYSDASHEVFLGKDIGDERKYSETVAAKIDEEVNKIIRDAYDQAKKIVSEHIDVLHEATKVLIEKEKITGDEFREIYEKFKP